ncbi:MAG TPA: CocE/NonD family hydrolase [Devosia sp.]|nr:CocE/NonD family hydrolase [Devosia sp.]
MASLETWILTGKVSRSVVMVPTRDGTKMCADVYVPTDRKGPGPTIVERTPYDRRNGELVRMAGFFAARGYNVVLQDTRGRGDSEGVFQHYLAHPHEGEDGHDLLNWIDAQDWSNGKVGTTGFSFTGSNQQSLAITKHPTLKSQVVFDAAINYFKRTVREDGAFVIGQLGTFALRMAITSPEARRDPLLRAQLDAVKARASDWYARAPWRAGASPVSALPAYEEWLLHAQDNPRENERWRNPQMMIEPYLDQYPDIPILTLTSWYGHHAWSTFLRLDRFKSHTAPKKVVVGTWVHTGPYGATTSSGDTEFGPDAALDPNEMRLRWFDATLRDIDRELPTKIPTISYFQMGGGSGAKDPDNRLLHGGGWRTTDVWPPTGGADLKLFLTPAGKLHVSASAEQGTQRLTANLEKPVPTIGSSIKNPDAAIPNFISSGGVDQVERKDVHLSPGTGLPLISRHDVLAFRSDPLEAALDITGPLYIRLWLSATTKACDLSLKIVDEYPSSSSWPNGFALNIADHYQRFATWTEELPGDADKPKLVEVGPIHIANRFEKGHRIRLQIANSSWPRYDRNPEADQRFEFFVWSGGDTDSSVGGAGVVVNPGQAS